jgi:hypothetical protein
MMKVIILFLSGVGSHFEDIENIEGKEGPCRAPCRILTASSECRLISANVGRRKLRIELKKTAGPMTHFPP